MRLKIIQLIIFILFCLLTGGLIRLQVVQGRFYHNLSVNNRVRIVPIEGTRGRITDRNGIILADTLISFDVVIVPQELTDKESLFLFLADVLDLQKEDLVRLFQRRLVARFIPVVLVENIDREHAVILEENKFRFPGLIIRTGSKRSYPFSEIGSHVLGYVGQINQARKQKFREYGYSITATTGYSGIEEYYDNFLRGEDGGYQIEVNHRGEQVRLLGMRMPVRGQDIALTIDSRIQEIAAELLTDKTGVIVVMDLETAEILAMVSSPAFDPNVFVDHRRSAQRIRLLSGSNAPMLNRAIGGQYPPGSVFKIPLAILGLQSQKIRTSTSFICNGFYQLGRRQFRCTQSHGVQNFTEAIAHSCNVYFYHLGLAVGPEAMKEQAYQLGLGLSTNIDLPHEEKGLIPDPDRHFRRARRSWGKGDTLNFSIGQGDLLTTPLQLVNMMAIVLRNGKKITPQILKSVGGNEYSRGIPHSYVDIPQSVFDAVKSGMRAAVEDYTGTARRLSILNLLIMGKTGTAQTSGDKDSHAWFIGGCPEARTKIVFGVFLEHGGSSYHATELARRLLLAMQKENIL